MNASDIQYLEKSLNNEYNKNISKLTFDNINKNKISVIQNLHLNKKNFDSLLKKLKDYQYIDELSDLVEGRYIRWINIINPNVINLTNGGILCEIKIEDTVILVMKNKINMFFQVDLDKNLIFQKLTDQEKIILYAVDLIK
jgi:hypothetical protein